MKWDNRWLVLTLWFRKFAKNLHYILASKSFTVDLSRPPLPFLWLFALGSFFVAFLSQASKFLVPENYLHIFSKDLFHVWGKLFWHRLLSLQIVFLLQKRWNCFKSNKVFNSFWRVRSKYRRIGVSSRDKTWVLKACNLRWIPDETQRGCLEVE